MAIDKDQIPIAIEKENINKGTGQETSASKFYFSIPRWRQFVTGARYNFTFQ